MEYRAAVKSMDKFSEPIRLWTNRSGDVYFSIRATARSFKVSFHAGGECHEAIHGEQFERMEEAGLSEGLKKKGRIWHKWHRAIDYEGIYPAFCIILPAQGFRDARVSERIPHFEIGNLPAAVFTLYFARVKSGGSELVELGEQALCVKHQLPNGEWVIVTLSAIDLPDLSALNDRGKVDNLSKLANVDEALASGNSLRAMVFASIQKGGFDIPCLIETSIQAHKIVGETNLYERNFRI